MMIKEITDLLAVFGGNLPLIAVGCVEGIAAVVLLGTGLQRKRTASTARLAGSERCWRAA